MWRTRKIAFTPTVVGERYHMAEVGLISLFSVDIVVLVRRMATTCSLSPGLRITQPFGPAYLETPSDATTKMTINTDTLTGESVMVR
jgi:hypothetical protein